MKTILDFATMKASGDKIAMVTCYDFTSALLVNASKADCILVGDSLAMTMHGFPDTLSADVKMMALHTAAVKRGAKDMFIVSDMPFLSFRKSLRDTVKAAGLLMQAGAQAVKIEGADDNLDSIRYLVRSGIPVMGHLGLTPQFVNQLGGFRVQGKTDGAAQKMKDDVMQLEEAGCFSVVLECVPAALSAEITRATSMATIGIGAGVETDGQVLVFQDLLGLNTLFKPKFVKAFAEGAAFVTEGVNAYAEAVHARSFPDAAHSFK